MWVLEVADIFYFKITDSLGMRILSDILLALLSKRLVICLFHLRSLFVVPLRYSCDMLRKSMVVLEGEHGVVTAVLCLNCGLVGLG